MNLSLARRGMLAAGALLLLVAAMLSLPPAASTAPASADVLAEALGRSHHDAQLASVVRAQGLVRAPAGGRCDGEYQFRTRRGLHCVAAPMLPHMFTAEQMAEDPLPSSYSDVGCIGDGTSGKRFQLVYARRSNVADRYAATVPKMRAWANDFSQALERSARKTGGHRQARWVTDRTCAATVLNVTVANDVTTFAQLVDALEAKQLTASDRKYLVAWDDSDSTDSFCGLGQKFPDATAGATNQNETQPLGAMFAAVQANCWRSGVVVHEIMHTLGAVQQAAPHGTPYGHCSDEADIMCYVDGPGVVLSRPCPSSQEAYYDCNGDDYFHTDPPVGNYLRTHWNTASSGWLEPTAPPVAGYAPFTSWLAWIERQHADIIDRPPTTAESAGAEAALQDGSKTKGAIVDDLRRGPENLSNVDPVVRVYRAFLGRAPDVGGLQFWIKRRRNEAPARTWTVTQIATEFTNSTEFVRKYGKLTNRQFVTQIYTDVLGRPADAAGVDYWTKKLDTKAKTKAQVMVGFSESNEYKTKQAQNTDLAVAYAYLLGRAPTLEETTTWVTRQKAGTAHAVLLEELLGSAAYAAHITG